MHVRERRFISRVVRFALVTLAIIIAGGWLLRKVPKPDHLRVEAAAPPVETLAAGDLQIFNIDSTVDVVLAGDRLSAGLSPQKLAEVRADLARAEGNDSGGLGGSIAQFAKRTVADKISLRAVYPLAEMRDLRYDGEALIIQWRTGGESKLLGDNIRIDGNRNANAFRPEDAERLIAAVRARLR